MIVVVDTGGTKTLVSSFDAKGEIHHHFKFPTPKKQEEYVALLTTQLQQEFAALDTLALVIGLPGIVKDGVAVWCNNLEWENFKAHEAFTGVLGKTPVYIENDANLAGLAEARALKPIPTSILYITISTGIGTGVITNGTIDPGLRFSEGGRTMIEYDGHIREWEDFAAGSAIRNAYGAYARDITSPTAWGQIADRISRGFLALIPTLQPEVIIIGGSVGTYFPRYADALESLLKAKLPSHIPCPRLLQASHPEEAVVYGGYYYAIDIINN